MFTFFMLSTILKGATVCTLCCAFTMMGSTSLRVYPSLLVMTGAFLNVMGVASCIGSIDVVALVLESAHSIS